MPKISTALREAAGHGHVAIVELLLAAGAQVDLANDVRAAAAARASRSPALALPPLLIACPPPPLSLSQHGNTPLIRAADNGHFAVVEVLLAAGANPDLGTPLSAAAGRDHLDVCRALLSAGADETIANTGRMRELLDPAFFELRVRGVYAPSSTR